MMTPRVPRPAQVQLSKRSPIGRALVRDPLGRNHALLLQQLAHELAGRPPVALGLEEHVQNLTFGVYGPPEIHLFATHTNEHLVEVPAAVRLCGCAAWGVW